MARNSNLAQPATSIAPSRLSLFGPPPVLEGEDSAAYDKLLESVSGAVKPTDIVEEIWCRDVVDLTWEIFRWRRLTTALFTAAAPDALTGVLAALMRRKTTETDGMAGLPNLDFTMGLRPPSPEEKLVKKWATRNPAAIDRVNKLMASANLKMDIVMAKALVAEFDHIERIDRLATIAEGRRNAVLREIDRHRATFARAMRDTVRDVEDAEFRIVNPNVVKSNKGTEETPNEQPTQN